MDIKALELICVIVNLGLGSKVMHISKHCGILGGTILLGRGTVNNRILEFLGISDIRKEIVLMAADKNTVNLTLNRLNKEFKFDKPNHGIAFTTSVCSIIGTRNCKSNNEESEVDSNMYNAITVITDKGKAEDVIEAATKAGSKGGTIINARGSGIHETSRLFNMDIEPEKEIVLILSKKDRTDSIVESIRNELNIDEPGMGIIFIQDVVNTYGIYE